MINMLGDLLPKDKYQEPPEVRQIKEFVRENFNQTPEVTIKTKEIIITVKGSAMAGSLRMRLHELQRMLETDKRLVIRIG